MAVGGRAVRAPTRSWRPGTDPGSLGRQQAVAVASPLRREPGVEVGGDDPRPRGPRPPGRAASSASGAAPRGRRRRCERRRRRPGPLACTPASVRPAHRERDVVAEHRARARRAARRRRCGRPRSRRTRGRRYRRRRASGGSSDRHGRDGAARSGRLPSTARRDLLRAQTSSSLAIGALSPVAGAELEDPRVAARAIGVAGPDLVHQHRGDLLVTEVGEDLAVVVQTALARLGDDLLGDRADRLGLGLGGDDARRATRPAS